MATRSPPAALPFFRATAAWLAGLLGLALLYQLLTGSFPESRAAAWDLAHLLAGWAGLLLPIVAFAGGLSVNGARRARSLLPPAILVALLAFLFGAVLSPLAQYRREALRGEDLATAFPAGAETPRGLLELKARAQDRAPEGYSFSVDRPLDRPPNWFAYLLHSRAAVAAFSVLSALLGWLTARLTTGLPPPARVNTRWAIGLATGVLFMAVESAAGDWIRGDPSRPATLAAWGPLLVPLLEMAVVGWLLHRREVVLHASSLGGTS